MQHSALPMAGTIVVLGGGSRKWRYEEEFQELAKLPSLLPEDGLRPLHPDTAISRKLGHVKDKKKKKAVKSDPISSSKQSKPVHVDGVYKARSRVDGCLHSVEKFVFHNSSGIPSAVERASKEVRRIITLDHPNIMKYIQGWFEYDTDTPTATQSSAITTNPETITGNSSLSSSGGSFGAEGKTAARASSLDELLSDSHDLQNDFLDPDDMDSSMTAITYTDYNLSNLSNSESDNDSEDLDSEIADMINNVRRTTISESFNGATLYLQMELCQYSLQLWLDLEGRKVDRRQNLDIFLQVVRGIEYAHKKGVVHGRLSPACLYLYEMPKKKRVHTTNLQVKIGGFGGAWTMESTVAGHIFRENCSEFLKWYGSPEQRLGAPASQKSDVYFLGILLFLLFHPSSNHAEQEQALMGLHRRLLPPNFLLQNPSEAAIILWLMSPEPEDRPVASEILNNHLLQSSVVVIPRNKYEKLEGKLIDQETKIQQQEGIIKEQERKLQMLTKSLQSTN